jgi:hypothetical protein
MISNEDYARLHKLPQWASALIRDQERRITDLGSQVESLTAEKPQGSNAVVNPYSAQSVMHLPRNPTVQFRRLVDDGSLHATAYLEVRFDGRGLEIHGQGMRHDDALVVRPQVSNAVRIDFVPNPD